MAELTLTQDEIKLLKENLQSEIDSLEIAIEDIIWQPKHKLIKQRIDQLKQLSEKLGRG